MSEMRLPVPSKFGQKILVAVLDENEKPVWVTTVVNGQMTIEPEDTYEMVDFTGSMKATWNSGVEITIRGRAENG